VVEPSGRAGVVSVLIFDPSAVSAKETGVITDRRGRVVRLNGSDQFVFPCMERSSKTCSTCFTRSKHFGHILLFMSLLK
jgi:hypothetical protein